MHFGLACARLSPKLAFGSLARIPGSACARKLLPREAAWYEFPEQIFGKHDKSDAAKFSSKKHEPSQNSLKSLTRNSLLTLAIDIIAPQELPKKGKE